jgi:hypothetical protein
MSGELQGVIIGILAGMVGGLFTGLLQYVTTYREERRKHLTETRTQAYQAYIDALSRLSMFNGAYDNPNKKDMTADQLKQYIELQSAFSAAKNRLSLYATPTVLDKIGTFASRHAKLNAPEDFEAYIDMIEAMRGDSFADNYSGFRLAVDNMMLRGMMT